ncbi:MAG TPA: hypothetical protein ENJ95_04370 [Bacteroidetes bacterium]|nr:hypothetical protein [Bacteroidota bacterium]
MNRTVVFEKINKMPDALMDTVADLLDKLIESYEIGRQSADSEEFTDEELDELDRRYEEMIAKPEETISHEDLLKYIHEKHGL